MKIRKNNVFYNGFSQQKISRLLQLAKTKKYSAPQLAAIFGCNKKTIFKALSFNHIFLPNLGRFKRKYNLNDAFFKELNPTSAYWIGFIAADGCLSKRDIAIGIGLKRSDEGHLKKFLRAINCNCKIHYLESNNSAKIEIYSKEIRQCLSYYGITPNKSLTISKVNVPGNLVSHFIRGVYDGDGTTSGRSRSLFQWMIAGNKPFLEQIQSVLIKECDINKVKIYPLKSKAYKIQYTGIQVFRILDFIYVGSRPEIRLDRKYNQYLYYKNKFKHY